MFPYFKNTAALKISKPVTCFRWVRYQLCKAELQAKTMKPVAVG